MRAFKDSVEACVAVLLAIISLPVGLLFMVAVLALPFVAAGLGIAVAVKAFSWIVGWPV